MFEVVFTKLAAAELVGAQDWYEREVPGLGRRFRSDVDSAVERMSANPLQFPVIYKSARRALLRHFPYMLFYTVQGDSLLVIACFHLSRDPSIWHQRT